MLGLRPPDLGDRRHDFPRYADAADDLVPGDVVGHQPENGRQRAGVAADSGTAELQNGLDVAPQVAAGDGAPQPGSFGRPC